MVRPAFTLARLSSALFCAFIGAAGLGVLADSQGKSNDDSPIARANLARLTGGLAAAAATSGFYVTEAPVNVGSPLSLFQLVSYSDVIARGKTLKNVSRLDASGQLIFMMYQVEVSDALKGHVQAGQVINVVVPGGRVSFADHSIAQVDTPGFMRPGNGDYLWCLRTASEVKRAPFQGDVHGNDTFVLAYGPMGLFDLSHSAVRTSARYKSDFSTDLVKQRYSPSAFLSEVESNLGNLGQVK